MSLSGRLLLFFAIFLTLGMSLLGSVVYDSFKQSVLKNDAQLLSVFDQKLHHIIQLSPTGKDSEVAGLQQILKSNETKNIRLFLLDPEKDLHTFVRASSLPAIVQQAVLAGNRNGHLFAEDKRYVWTIHQLPGSRYSVLTLYAKTDDSFGQFIDEFALPIFISAMLMLWMLLWLSLFIGKLFKTLDLQKRKLEEQTDELATAHEKAVKANQAKSIFLANMSHEIRTPLTAIIGYSDAVLGSDQTKEERLASINTINSCSKHVLNVINEILDLSKIEADKLDVEKMMVSPIKILTEASSLMSMQANDKNLAFKVNLTSPVPAAIVTDPTRLKQILLNLFGNAVKFTTKGHVTIEVSCERDQQQMTFRVIDSGIGMTEEQCSKIFNAFEQADTSTARKFGGTGLGLSLSKKLVQLLGGDLSVSSEPGKGSTFTFTISTDRLDRVEFIDKFDSVEPVVHNTPIPIPTNIISGHILLAEDTEANQQLLSMYVKKMGAQITVVENGEEVIDAAFSSDFDLILMDMQMPVMNGLDATIMLRENNYQKPIVALTANVSVDDRRNFLAAGCNDFLAKPIDRQQFVEVLAKHLKPANDVRIDNTPVTSTLLANEPEFVDLVSQFVNALPDILQEIRVTAERNDWDELKVLVHNLKGTSGNYGYMQLSDLTAKLEFQIINKNRYEIDELLRVVDAYCERIIAGAPLVTAKTTVNNKIIQA